jgi:hydrogenase maturation factor
MRFPAGKVPPEVLKRVVFKYLGATHSAVAVGPQCGLDGAVVEVGDQSVITAMDPITGASKRLGWLAVNVNANDVATFGVKPLFFSSCLLLPENATEATVETICRHIDAGAKQLDIAIIGGHTETTPNLSFPIIVGSCMGIADPGRYVTAAGAHAGDKLILTKSVGIEGTAILATDRRSQLATRLEGGLVSRAAAYFDHISVVPEALAAFHTGHVTAMHDPTEGGVAGGLHELADASKLGFKVHEAGLAVTEETRSICAFFNIDPLQLIASGSLLIAVENNRAETVVDTLAEQKIPAAIIGELHASPHERVFIRKSGAVEQMPCPMSDSLWTALQSGD